MHLVSAIVSLNQAAKAKTKYADDLRHNMETELEKVWPDVMQKYKELMLDGPKKEEDGVAVEVKREDRMDTDAG